jgi:uncharacterized protein (PEP-CTERM system associated)
VCAAPWLLAALLCVAGQAEAQTPYATPGLLNPMATTNNLDTSALNAPAPEEQNVAPVPPLRFQGQVSLAGAYATNPEGGSTPATEGSDEYGQVGLQTSLRYNTRRAQIVGDYSFFGNYYAKFHNLNAYLNYLNLASTTQIIPDHLVLNLTAFASPVLLNRTGGISASGVPTSSLTGSNTYGYIVQPEYTFRIRDFLTSTTTFSQQGIYFVSPFLNASNSLSNNVSNASTIGATQRFASGDYFGRFHWVLNGDYQKVREQSFHELSKDGTLDLGYAIDHTFQLLATGGYNQFEANVPLNRALSGPEGLGGFLFTPSPSMKLMVEAGVRNRTTTYIGTLHWEMSPLTTLDGILNDGIYTPQGSMLNSLGGYGASLLNPGFGISPISPSPVISPFISPQLGTVSPVLSQGLAIDNFIYHDRLANVTLTHTLGRTSVGLTFYNDTRTQLVALTGAPPNASLNGVTLSVNREMRDDLSGYASVSYSSGNEFGGHDEILFANVGFNLALSETLSLYGYNRFLYHTAAQVSVGPGYQATDDETVIGIRRNF